MRLKVSGLSSPGMLAMLFDNPVYLLGGEEYSTPDLDDVDNAGLSPACQGLNVYPEELGCLSRGEELPLEVHCPSTSSRILYSVLGWGLLLLFRKSQTVLGSLFILLAISWMVKS